MSVVETIENAYILIEGDTISAFGSMENMPERADVIIDAEAGLVMPCWCDSHTHIVFAEGREGEYVDRLKGVSYEEIAKKGGTRARV